MDNAKAYTMIKHHRISCDPRQRALFTQTEFMFSMLRIQNVQYADTVIIETRTGTAFHGHDEYIVCSHNNPCMHFIEWIARSLQR